VQANGGHFNWAANDRKALLSANIERFRNPNYSGPSSIGQTASSRLVAENSVTLGSSTASIALRLDFENFCGESGLLSRLPLVYVVISELWCVFAEIPSSAGLIICSGF